MIAGMLEEKSTGRDEHERGVVWPFEFLKTKLYLNTKLPNKSEISPSQQTVFYSFLWFFTRFLY